MGTSGSTLKNYHTHTIYCGHANNTVLEMVEEAYQNNFSVLGFSEHGYIDIPRFHHTIQTKEIESTYLMNIKTAKKMYPNMTIYSGFEMDYTTRFNDYYKSLLKRVDYLSLSVHFLERENTDFPGTYEYTWLSYMKTDEYHRYYDAILEGLKLNVFSFINHPDIFIYENTIDCDELKAVEEKIIDAAMTYDTPLELNLAQYHRYKPLYEDDGLRYKFWRLVEKKKAKVIINFDAHDRKYLNKDYYHDMDEFLNKFNFNIVDEINWKK